MDHGLYSSHNVHKSPFLYHFQVRNKNLKYTLGGGCEVDVMQSCGERGLPCQGLKQTCMQPGVGVSYVHISDFHPVLFVAVATCLKYS